MVLPVRSCWPPLNFRHSFHSCSIIAVVIDFVRYWIVSIQRIKVSSSVSRFRHFVSEIFVSKWFPSVRATWPDAVTCPNLYRWIWSVHSAHLWLTFLFVDMSKGSLAFVAVPTSPMLHASISRLYSFFKVHFLPQTWTPVICVQITWSIFSLYWWHFSVTCDGS